MVQGERTGVGTRRFTQCTVKHYLGGPFQYRRKQYKEMNQTQANSSYVFLRLWAEEKRACEEVKCEHGYR